MDEQDRERAIRAHQIKCGPVGSLFWNDLRDICLFDMGIQLTSVVPRMEKRDGKVVQVKEIGLNPSMRIDPTFLALVSAKQDVFRDLERWAQAGGAFLDKELGK